MNISTVTPGFTKAMMGILPSVGIYLSDAIQQRINSLPAGQRLPMTLQDDFWREIENQTEDSHIGLAIGQALQPAHYDMVGYLLLSSPSLAVAVQGLVEYSSLIGEGGHFEHYSAGKGRCLAYQAEFEVARRIRIEAILSGIVTGAKSLLGEGFSPEEVGFEHHKMGDVKCYQQIFSTANICFAQKNNYVTFSEHNWRQQISSGSEQVQQQMHRLAQQQLQQLHPQTLEDKVTALLNQQPRLSRTQVASVLAISERHLNRKLAEHQLSFKKLADGIRKELAVEMLTQGEHSQASMAHYLGYSDESAFAKAFRRWMGMGVRAFRKNRI